MTFTDTLIPVLYWVENGFGKISQPMAIVNLTLLIITMITVKGLYIPLWVIPIIFVVVITGCVLVGWILEKYNINGRIATHVTRNQNPMLNEMYEDIKKMKKKLEIE